MKFSEILSEHRIAFQTQGKHCRAGWLQLDCPFCKGSLYLGYNTFGNYCNCWRCGPKSASEVLVVLTGLPFKEFRELEREQVKTETIARGKLVTPSGVGPLLKPHRRYLKGRGYNVQELKRLWHIEAIGIHSRLAWRIYIPICYQGEPVSWTTRSISDHVDSRYISADPNSERINHKELVYGSDYVRHAAIICEGPFDVWKIGPGAVCTFGTGFKRAQLVELSKFPVRVVCYDSEPKAQQRAKKLCDALEAFDGQTYRVVLRAKDAGSASKQEIDELRSKFLV